MVPASVAVAVGVVVVVVVGVGVEVGVGVGVGESAVMKNPDFSSGSGGKWALEDRGTGGSGR